MTIEDEGVATLEEGVGDTPAVTQDDDDAAYSERVKKTLIKERRRRQAAEADAEAARAMRNAAEERARKAEGRAAELELTHAKERARKAYADGDPDAQVEANAEISRASRRVDDAARAPAPEPRPSAPSYTERTQEWLDDNPWYDSDQDAKRTAQIADGEARAHGLTPDSEPFWAYIDAKVRAKHKHLFDEPDAEAPVVTPPRQSAVVAPARRTTPNAAATKSKLPALTAQELEFAKYLNMSPQEYSASKAKMNGST